VLSALPNPYPKRLNVLYNTTAEDRSAWSQELCMGYPLAFLHDHNLAGLSADLSAEAQRAKAEASA
jgi:hypothetical protein